MKKKGLIILLVLTLYILLGTFVVADTNCTDSDAKDYFVKGTVNFNDTSFQDRCNFEWGETIDDTKPISSVIEYFCDNNVMKFEFYKCPEGCDHGVCINYIKPENTEEEDQQEVFEYDLPLKGEFCESDKILICHLVDSEELTICIPEPDIYMHLDHDDYLGVCVGEKREQHILRMEANRKYELEFKNLPITNLNVEVNKQKTQSRIIVRAREKIPQSLSKPKGLVAKYIIIEHPDLAEEDISVVKIKFKVEKEWVENNTNNESSVVLKKYNVSRWIDLPTSHKNSDSNFYYYESDSGSLSVFAISFKEEKEISTIIEEPPEKEPEEVSLVPKEIIESEPKISPYVRQIILISVATVTVTLILLFIVQYFSKKRQHSDIEDDVQKRLDLLDYVLKSREEGASDEAIILNLKKKGYSTEIINNTLSTNYKYNK